MGTNTNQTTSQENGPILQLKRPLLPIDEYAAREGLSKSLVEECGKLGIVQIRKYKGKTFVVDVPLSTHPYTSEITAEAAQPTDKTIQAKKISELLQKVISGDPILQKARKMGVPDMPETPDERAESNNESVEAGAISALVKMLREASKITDKPVETVDDETDQAENIPESIQTMSPEILEIINELTAAADEITRTESPSKPIKPPDMDIFEITDEPSEAADETVEAVEMPQSTHIPQNDGFQVATLTAQARSKRIWQIATFFSLTLLFAALSANIWFYMDRQIQLHRLDLANASIQQSLNNSANNSAKANQRAEIFQNELDNSRAEVNRLNTELDNSRAEVNRLNTELDRSKAELKTVQNELTQARQNLKTIHERNARAVERLNRQIQKLSGQPAQQLQ